MLIVKFKPNDTTELDWSDYIIGLSPISRKVESEKPGEAGVIVFDQVSLEIPLSHTGNYFDESTLSTAIANGDRYIFDIKYDFNGTIIDLFSGMVDFDSIEYPESETVKFQVLDKLSALTILENENPREDQNIIEHRIEYFNNPLVDQLRIYPEGLGTQILGYSDELGEFINQNNKILFPSEIVIDPGNLENKFITFSQLRYHNIYQVYYTYIETAPAGLSVTGPINNLNYKTYFFNRDIGYYHPSTSRIIYLDAIKIIRAIINKKWSDANLQNKTGYAYYPIPLDFWEDLIDSCFDQHPLNALKWLANMMRIYIYFDSQGRPVLQKIPLAAQTPALTIDNDKILNRSQKFSWDKKIDYVHIIAHHPDGSSSEGENPQNIKIIPRNSLEREVLIPANEIAQDIADEYWDFYGKRHKSYSLKIPLEQNTAALEMADTIRFDGIDYFLESLNQDIQAMITELGLVEIAGHDN